MANDLDQSGNSYQDVDVYLGPSLGWTTVRVRPETLVTVGGSTTLLPDASVVLVNVAATVTLNLPNVATWVKEIGARPTTAFERSIYIKDFGQNAGTFNITVHPFAGQRIDGSLSDYVINNTGQMLRLYALNDFSGWYIESNNQATLVDGSVTNAKLANMAAATFKMRALGAGTGPPIDGTPAQAKTALAITAADIGSGAALSKVDDTNVTMALGGGFAAALLSASSLTMGWAGLLSKARGGTNSANGAALKMNIQSFSANGTYTPTAGMLFCLLVCVGPAGGSGGVLGAVGNARASGGGGSGGLSIKAASAADIGASKAVTVPAGGNGGAAGANDGANGAGATSIGALCIANPGSGGQNNNGSNLGVGGAGASVGTGDITWSGTDGGNGFTASITTVAAVAGFGGPAPFSGSVRGVALNTNGTTQGFGGNSPGGGASGSVSFNVATNVAGSAGSNGLAFVIEFLSQ